MHFIAAIIVGFGLAHAPERGVEAVQPVALHLDVDTALPPTDGRSRRLSESEGRAVVGQLVRFAQECLVEKVTANPRFRDAARTGRVGDLIVEAVPQCHRTIDELITAHDQTYGQGTGEDFVVGPFLDGIPRALDGALRALR
jgi:hypothetical protein